MNFIQSLTLQMHAHGIPLPQNAVTEFVKAAISEADDLGDLSDLLDFTHCGCGKEIRSADDAELCWWCHAPMCGECWEQVGHCGHEEAEAINERAREWYREQEQNVR